MPSICNNDAAWICVQRCTTCNLDKELCNCEKILKKCQIISELEAIKFYPNSSVTRIF